VFRSRLAAALVVIAALVAQPTLLVSESSADTESDLAAARRRVKETQAQANEAAGELSEAEGRFQELEARITELEGVIRATQDRANELEDYVRQRAVHAYTQSGASDFDVVFSAGSVEEANRRTKLLDLANAKDDVSARKLASLRDAIARDRAEVAAQRDQQRQVKEQLDTKLTAVQSSLAEATKARDELVARLEREQADARAAAELARLRAIQAATQTRAPDPAGSDGSSSGGAGGEVGGPGQIIANPGSGSFQCPLVGSAYSNSYGPRGNGFHYGIDMMAPTGRPEVAVKSGSVSYVPMGGAGGNEAYLAADDGNVYYYAHMSQFVGGARRVAQGEIIGLVGSTGSSSAPHLHFEIRVGGANGQRINPYPTLQSAGC
jgi:murein DD-endopeptidase MepM/ murein hydrolase activator NlpD